MDVPNFSDLLDLIKTKLWIAGIVYGQRKIHIRFYILFTSLTLIVIQQLAYLILYSSFENFPKMMQTLACISSYVTGTVQIAALFVKHKEVNELTNYLQDLYKNILMDDTKRNIVRNEMIFLNKLIKAFTILNVILVSVFNTPPIFTMLFTYMARKEVVYDLPLPVAVPFATDQWFPWLVEYMMSVVAVYLCVLLISSFNCVYFFLSTHVFVNFIVLCESIKKMYGSESTQILKENIRNHQHIIRLSELLDDIFHVPNLINILLGTVQICFLMFTIKIGSWSSISKCAFFLMSIILQLFMTSHYGENLLSASGKVGDAAYECNWYNMDVEARKMIRFIILRSQKPQQLTGYNFTQISYASFTAIMSKSWSYFTILQTVYKPPEIIQK